MLSATEDKHLTTQLRGATPQQIKQNIGVSDMSQDTESGRVSIPLQRELEALLLDDKLTQEQRARMKWDYIVEKNDRLSLENQALKLWIGSLLAADGFDNGCYDSQNLRIARDKLKEILDNPIRF